MIHKWKNAIVVKSDGEVDKEKLAMRKQIRELQMENEILKKAALIFGRDKEIGVRLAILQYYLVMW